MKLREITLSIVLGVMYGLLGTVAVLYTAGWSLLDFWISAFGSGHRSSIAWSHLAHAIGLFAAAIPVGGVIVGMFRTWRYRMALLAAGVPTAGLLLQLIRGYQGLAQAVIESPFWNWSNAADLAKIPAMLLLAVFMFSRRPPPTGARATPTPLIVLLTIGLAVAEPLHAQSDASVDDVVLHPVTKAPYVCAEHAAGEFSRLGDALGKDCMVIGMDTTGDADRPIPSLFQGDGLDNEDWFGWEEPVLAPCDGTVVSIDSNDQTNRPGEIPDRETLEPASEIRFECQKGFNVVYAHVRKIRVHSGESVTAGQEVALIGNNAVSKAPHVHLGAWRKESPLQIRFDLNALGELRRRN